MEGVVAAFGRKRSRSTAASGVDSCSSNTKTSSSITAAASKPRPSGRRRREKRRRKSDKWDQSVNPSGRQTQNLTSQAAAGTKLSGVATVPPVSPAARGYHTCCSFDGKLVLIGGIRTLGALCNDVWESQDGFTWECCTPNADFSPRCDHACCVVDNSTLLVLGGCVKGRNQRSSEIWGSVNGGRNWSKVSLQDFCRQTQS